jgi:hypothetical protein
MLVKGESMEIESSPTMLPKQRVGRKYVPWWMRIMLMELGLSRPCVGDGIREVPN